MTRPARPLWSPPREIEEYRLVRELGRGAMGYVYLAEDTLLDRTVALKLIAQARPDAAARARFQEEARAIARLSHPNVAAIYRIGETGGLPYLVIEHVRGQTLAEIARPLPPGRVRAIGAGLARGLAAIHRSGVLHRDIKPANVLCTEDGHVKIVDFGLAKLLGQEPVHGSREGAPRPRAPDRSESGDVVGTPLYAAPELLRGEPATRRSEVYALGAVLHDLYTGLTPRDAVPADAPEEAWIDAAPPPLEGRGLEIDEGLIDVVVRCLAVDPAARPASADEVADALEAGEPVAAASEASAENPYRGLLPFDAEHRRHFLGRDAEARAVLDRLRAEPLVVVAGDSGVGKSSLCRAAVMPLVAEGTLGGGRVYTTAALVPGRSPLHALAAALSPVTGLAEAEILELARGDRFALGRAVRRSLAADRGLLLFVDQAEELVTLSDAEEARLFSEALAHTGAMAAGVRVLVALRGDLFTAFAALPGLGAEVGRAFYLLRPLSAEAARLAVVGPAARMGVRFESEALVEELVETVVRSAGGLPLIQFALAELWEARDREGRVLRRAALDALGGAAGALARHADAVYLALGEEHRGAARRALTSLVTAHGTRARRTAAELTNDAPEGRAALEGLIRGRLVVAREVQGEVAYEIAHEALLSAWKTLRDWLDAEGDLRAQRERVAAAAAEWDRLGRSPDALWSARQLAEVTRLETGDLPERSRTFLGAARGRARRGRALRWLTALAVPSVVVLSLAGLRWKARRDLDVLVDGHTAAADRDRAEATRLRDESKDRQGRAYTLFYPRRGESADEAGRRHEEAEVLWTEALAAARGAEVSFGRATRELEAAFALDPTRGSLRAAIGDVQLERVALAGRMHQPEAREEHFQRLLNYDDDGARRRRLDAPPHLAVVTSPPGARITYRRYEDQQGKRQLGPVRAVAQVTPAEDVTIDAGPGSYLVTLEVPGRPPVRYPILLERDERVRIDVPIPPAEAVPEGYVFVPPGRFLAGSAEPEQLRKGLIYAPPLHAVQTEGYLIARTEVTYAEWIAFLEALSPAEIAKHNVRTQTNTGMVELVRSPSGEWQITMGSNGARATAKAGEKISFPARARRVEQDWLRFPVAGVNRDDALAYAAWLSATGKVRGARLCTEVEWERAARGADGRLFPSGDRLDADDADFDETYGRKSQAFGPDEVGAHPASESPFGLMDMMGNVYEWATPVWTTEEGVIRGGAWYYDRPSGWVMNRTVTEPAARDVTIGMRLCAPAP